VTPLRTAFAVAGGIVALAAGVLLCLCLWEGYQTARDLHREALLTLEHANRDLIVIGGLSANIEKASRSAQAAAEEQRRYWAEAAQRTNRTLADFDAATIEAGSVLRELHQTIASQDRNLSALSAKVENSVEESTAAIQSLRPGIAALNETAQNAAKLTGDPAIPATLAEVKGIATDTHTTTTVIAGMAVASQKPKRRILTYLEIAGKVLAFLFYAKHQ
jgi:hypothetical protein